jgi:hypothetical protein
VREYKRGHVAHAREAEMVVLVSRKVVGCDNGSRIYLFCRSHRSGEYPCIDGNCLASYYMLISSSLFPTPHVLRNLSPSRSMAMAFQRQEWRNRGQRRRLLYKEQLCGGGRSSKGIICGPCKIPGYALSTHNAASLQSSKSSPQYSSLSMVHTNGNPVPDAVDGRAKATYAARPPFMMSISLMR